MRPAVVCKQRLSVGDGAVEAEQGSYLCQLEQPHGVRRGIPQLQSGSVVAGADELVEPG
jgi:hypothetical protein